ncbi:uncharacterized protein LOC120424032 [Culex pipiens pallens]|uniref:uncharacterized protein LOC120424032 n=1 Tax=Culex pipiens pallens TaxID=42434 RepID=UPI001953AD49|nr:uncharacterized protein LOC120424032 [Culex pipiens pallens]
MWRSFLGLNTEPKVEPEEGEESEQEASVQKKPEPEARKPVVHQLPLTPKQRHAESKRKMADEEVQALLNRRGHVKGKLTRVRTVLGQPGIPASRIQVCKANAEKYYAIKSTSSFKLSEEQKDENTARFLDFEQLYDEVLERIVELTAPPNRVQAVVPAGQAGQQVIVQQTPLRAPIPTFDGQYENWPKFKSMFLELMKNSPDSDAIKLHYLDKSLVGAATGMIDTKTLQDNNYAHAWEILEDRYENQRLIIDIHINGILQLKRMAKKSSKELRELYEECSRHVENLRYHKQELLGVSELFVVNILSSCLDRETREQWEATVKKGELPKYAQTIEFLKQRCAILERCELAAPASSAARSTVPKAVQSSKPSAKITSAAATSNEAECDLCDGSHANYKCGSFRGMSVAERWSKVRDARLCYNCLRKGHRVGQCPSDRSCKCGEKHHSLLHQEKNQQQNKPKLEAAPGSAKAPSAVSSASVKAGPSGTGAPEVSDENEQQATSCFSSGALKSPQQVLLQTAIINVADKAGRFHPCRTLLDSGSQAHILSEAMARTLGLTFEKCNVTVIGANAVKTQAKKGVNLTFSSRYCQFQDNISCLISDKPTGRIPSARIETAAWHIPSDVFLADPKFSEPHEIDLVMASNYVWDLLRTDRVKLANGTVTLRETDLGWIVTGVYDPFQQLSCQVVHSNITLKDQLNNAIEKFWLVEELADKQLQTNEEQEVEEHFRGTHGRDESGRFVVQLPFKDTVLELGDNRVQALRRFNLLERRLSRNPDLREQYTAFVEEYEALGHCKEIYEQQDPPEVRKYYLPHHAVLKPSSSSTKLRVVFDASAKAGKYSLNDVLKVGPTVQNDLFSIVLRFRRHPVAFTADVVKMYRQVRVHPSDTPYQRIFWRKDPNERLRVLELNTVTYGTASAPFLATRCLVEQAESAKGRFPAAAKIVIEDMYVDDMLSGASSEKEAVKLVLEVKKILEEGGFPVKKWCSNSEQVLKCVPEEDREKPKPIEEYSANEAIKALGVLWDPREDEFRFVNCLEECDDKPVSKTKVFSDILKVFDPLGFVAPVIVLAKVFMQKLWASKMDWATELNEELLCEWFEIRESLTALNDICVPRCVVVPNTVLHELHGFADASTVAYGANVYLRCIRGNGSAEANLLCAKSRVAPLKKLSVPNLELCAALLLARLVVKVIETLDLELSVIELYSDSQIVLAWLKKDPNLLETFVRNRVIQILNLTGKFRWNYVRSADNPADIVSRGMSPKLLSRCPKWWKGLLPLTSAAYVPEEPPELEDDELPGLVAIVYKVTVEMPVFKRFGEFRKLQRVICYIRRFVQNCRNKKSGQPRTTCAYVTVPETRAALKSIIWSIQMAALPDEFYLAKTEQASSQLASLAPIVDEDGLLRVGGRLEHSSLTYEAKHPVILPRHHVTTLLVRALHVENLHVGPSGLLAIVRQQYWPLKARNVVRDVTRKCLQCFKANPRRIEQFMGQLPAERVNVAAPFEYTGVDYAGPVTVKQGKYRPKLTKAYIAVFVCLVTKNIHLELVSDLTTEAFLAALDRFVNRRGMVRKIFSDNATNFVGASRSLREMHELFKQDLLMRGIQDLLVPKAIEWSFIPPRAPNFGGLWEAGVKSVKTHLKRTLQNAVLTFEEFATILTHVEAVLNSRPLFSLSDSPGDPLPITPAHLQLGRPLRPVAKPSRSGVADNRLNRWEYLDKLREDFWGRWSREYLTSLQNRAKWTKKSHNLQPGMLVLLVEDNLPSQTWKVGIIVETYPGMDALVRVVDVKTGSGAVFKRSVSKLAPLPTVDNDRLLERFGTSE